MIMAQGLFHFLFNKYLHVTVLFGIIKQIAHGSEGAGTDYQPLKIISTSANTFVDIIFLGLIICTVTLTAMCYLYTII